MREAFVAIGAKVQIADLLECGDYAQGRLVHVLSALSPSRSELCRMS
jgi:hypothetical protein